MIAWVSAGGRKRAFFPRLEIGIKNLNC